MPLPTLCLLHSAHAEVMRARRKWFVPMKKEVYVALWWVPSGHRPSVREAEDRVAHLRQHGSTAFAFTFKQPFSAARLRTTRHANAKRSVLSRGLT